MRFLDFHLLLVFLNRFPEPRDIAGVKFYLLIGISAYLFVSIAVMFNALYKLAMNSNQNTWKNIFLFLMSVLMRNPTWPLKNSERKESSSLTVKKAYFLVWKEVIFLILATIWLALGIYIGISQINEMKQ